MAHDINTNLIPIDFGTFEDRYDVVDVFSPDDWAEMLDVAPACIWVVLPVEDRTIENGSKMVVAAITPETPMTKLTDFAEMDPGSVICYLQTKQPAQKYLVELTIGDMVNLGMSVSEEMKAALRMLDVMKAGTDQPYTDRDMRPVGWDLGRVRRLAERFDGRLGEYVNPYTDKNRTIRRHLRNVGQAALDLGVELLPYARVFLAGVVLGRVIEAAAREAVEAGK